MANEPGGLIGAGASLGAAATRAAKKTYGIVANPDAWALRLVFFAGVITVLKKAGVPIPEYMVLFGVALGIAALLYEMSASRAAVRAWWEGRPGAMLWSGVIWAVAFGFSVNNWIGAASEGQVEKTNVHKAAFNQSADVRKAVTDLEKELARLEGKYDWSKSLDAPESYDDRIKAAEADAQFEATRKGCKSKCIQKQQLAASLKAERANAIDRATTAEEIKATKGRLDDARKVASNTKVETSEARNDLLILTNYMGMSEQSAQIFNGLFSIIVVSIFLSFGSMRAELEELRKTHGARKRSHLLMRLWCGLVRILTGRDPKHVSIDRSITVNGDDASDVRARLARQAEAASRLLGPGPALTGA